jgi:hypothetical protein
VFAGALSRRRGRRRERLHRLLAAVLDARMWHQLRREQGLDVKATQDHLMLLVESLLAS